MFDYSKLRGKIKEKCGTLEVFADAIGISPTSLNKRLKNEIPFSQNEIYKASQLFGTDPEENDQIFFTEEIQKTV